MSNPDSDNAYEKIFTESVAELAADHGILLLVRTRAGDAETHEAISAISPGVMVVAN